MNALANGALPQTGDIVRLFEWCGIVRHIYLREDEQDAYLEIRFVKNIFKQQKPELQLWSKMGEYIEPATADDLRAEIASTAAEIEKNLAALLAETAPGDFPPNSDVPHPGNVIRWLGRHGVVQRMYSDLSNQDICLEVMFAKNIFQERDPEFLLWSKIGSNVVRAVTADLEDEIARLNAKCQQETDAILGLIQEQQRTIGRAQDRSKMYMRGASMYTLEIRVDNLQSLEQGDAILDTVIKLAECYGAIASGSVSDSVPWEVERAAILDALELVGDQESADEKTEA